MFFVSFEGALSSEDVSFPRVAVQCLIKPGNCRRKAKLACTHLLSKIGKVVAFIEFLQNKDEERTFKIPLRNSNGATSAKKQKVRIVIWCAKVYSMILFGMESTIRSTNVCVSNFELQISRNISTKMLTNDTDIAYTMRNICIFLLVWQS